MRFLSVIFLLACTFTVPVKAEPILLSQTGPGTGSWTLGADETNAVSWILTGTIADFSIAAKLVASVTVTAYLTNKIGPDATEKDVVTRATFTENGGPGGAWQTIFSGLTLGPGLYY